MKNFGVQTVVDATPDDLGRNVELNKIIANETGLNIICSTGKYMDPGNPGLSAEFTGKDNRYD